MSQKIKISTDSTSDIPKDLLEKHNITMIPLTILANETEYKDGVDISYNEFYKLMEECEQIPTSSAITPFTYCAFFEKIFNEGYTDLIHVAINSKGSSTYQNSLMAVEMFFSEHPEAKDKLNIHILDSKTYSMAYGLGVVEAAKLNESGKSVDEIIDFLKDWIEHAKAVFVPLDLKVVKKSGRVSAAAAFVGDVMGIKPIIAFIDGEAVITEKVRGEKAVISKLVDYCNSERKSGTPYALARVNNDSAFASLKELADEKIGDENRMEYNLGCIITMNTGPNAIGIIYRT